MAYENIKITNPNFTVVYGQFYTFDHNADMLICKTDDGDTIFSYPLSVCLTNEIKVLEHDGYYFWTLENPSDIIIRRWEVSDSKCALKQTLTYNSDSYYDYDVNSFAVEHYHTSLASTISSGAVSIITSSDYSSVVLA